MVLWIIAHAIGDTLDKTYVTLGRLITRRSIFVGGWGGSKWTHWKKFVLTSKLDGELLHQPFPCLFPALLLQLLDDRMYHNAWLMIEFCIHFTATHEQHWSGPPIHLAGCGLVNFSVLHNSHHNSCKWWCFRSYWTRNAMMMNVEDWDKKVVVS